MTRDTRNGILDWVDTHMADLSDWHQVIFDSAKPPGANTVPRTGT